MEIVITLYLTICSALTGECEVYKPASWASADLSALSDCEAVARGMPAELHAHCGSAFDMEE